MQRPLFTVFEDMRSFPWVMVYMEAPVLEGSRTSMSRVVILRRAYESQTSGSSNLLGTWRSMGRYRHQQAVKCLKHAYEYSSLLDIVIVILPPMTLPVSPTSSHLACNTPTNCA